MYYIYSLLMFAWDLDKDTHSEFRKYFDHLISLRRVSKDIHHLAGQLRYMPRNAIQFYEQGPHMRFVLESLRMNKRRWWWRENIIVRLPSPFRMTHSYPIECRTSIDKIHEEKQIERLNQAKEEWRFGDD